MASHETLIYETLQRMETAEAYRLEELRKQTKLLEEIKAALSQTPPIPPAQEKAPAFKVEMKPSSKPTPETKKASSKKPVGSKTQLKPEAPTPTP